MGKYSDVPSQTPLVRPKSAIYTPKVDATSIPVTFMCPPPPRFYLPFCLQAEAVVRIQNLSDGANSYPSVQNKDQDLKRTNINLTKVNKQVNEKKRRTTTTKKTRSNTLPSYCQCQFELPGQKNTSNCFTFVIYVNSNLQLRFFQCFE